MTYLITTEVFLFLAGAVFGALVCIWIAAWRSRIVKRRYAKKVRVLREEATTDALTGLGNQRNYLEVSSKLWGCVPPDDQAIVVMDVNGLKMVNDTLGHSMGNKLLQEMASIVQETFCPYGMVFRMSGDEFVALLNCSEMELEEAVGSLRQQVFQVCNVGFWTVGLAIGAAHRQEFLEVPLRKLLTTADERMYEDKHRWYEQQDALDQ